MNPIVLVFIIFLAGAVLSFLGNKLSKFLGASFFLLTIISATAFFFLNVKLGEEFSFQLMGMDLQWELTYMGRLFSLIVLGLGSMAAIYSISYMKGRDSLGYFYFNFILGIFSMTGILLSRDLVSFFVFWEIMTWSSYFIVVYDGRDVQKVGIKYILFSAVGAYAMLMAIVMAYSEIHSVMIDDLAWSFSSFQLSHQLWMVILLLTGFGVKAAMMPLHVWAPGAYSRSPMAYTSVFSGALSKMGVYGMVLVFTSLVSQLPQQAAIRDVISWMGAITSVLGTFWAITRDDAKELLAWSSVAQLGYIITGVAIGTELSMLAALFLAVMHALFKGTLFMVVGAIEKQTGTTDLTVVTGLIRKMPWTFIAALMSIIALAGIPPLGGFIGKWMLYESLIGSDNYILVVFTFLASTAGFLYCYKFLFGFFLGQEEKEWEFVKEAPATMVIPMLILSALSFVLGTFPGLLLKPIDMGMQEMGYLATEGYYWNMSMLFNEWGNAVMLQPILYAIMAVFLVFLVFLTLKAFKGTRYVTTKDISSSGEVPREDENLSFKQDFFRPFLRAIEPVMKRQVDNYYRAVGSGMEAFFDFLRRVYTGNGQTYAIYIIVFLVVLLLLKSNLFG